MEVFRDSLPTHIVEKDGRDDDILITFFML
jgi:hypothetical protein